VIRELSQGKVKSIVETYPLAEAAKAYEWVAEGKARFRAVLTLESQTRAVTVGFEQLMGNPENGELRSPVLRIRRSSFLASPQQNPRFRFQSTRFALLSTKPRIRVEAG